MSRHVKTEWSVEKRLAALCDVVNTLVEILEAQIYMSQSPGQPAPPLTEEMYLENMQRLTNLKLNTRAIKECIPQLLVEVK